MTIETGPRAPGYQHGAFVISTMPFQSPRPIPDGLLCRFQLHIRRNQRGLCAGEGQGGVGEGIGSRITAVVTGYG